MNSNNKLNQTHESRHVQLQTFTDNFNGLTALFPIPSESLKLECKGIASKETKTIKCCLSLTTQLLGCGAGKPSIIWAVGTQSLLYRLLAIQGIRNGIDAILYSGSLSGCPPFTSMPSLPVNLITTTSTCHVISIRLTERQARARFSSWFSLYIFYNKKPSSYRSHGHYKIPH